MADSESLRCTITVRDALRKLLTREAQTLSELSTAVGRPESEIVDHLRHLERSLKREDQTIEGSPAACLGCGFSFDERRRFKRPGKCPSCRGTRLSYPSFFIIDG